MCLIARGVRSGTLAQPGYPRHQLISAEIRAALGFKKPQKSGFSAFLLDVR